MQPVDKDVLGELIDGLAVLSKKINIEKK